MVYRSVQVRGHERVRIVIVEVELNEIFSLNCRLVMIKLAQRHLILVVVRDTPQVSVIVVIVVLPTVASVMVVVTSMVMRMLTAETVRFHKVKLVIIYGLRPRIVQCVLMRPVRSIIGL